MRQPRKTPGGGAAAITVACVCFFAGIATPVRAIAATLTEHVDLECRQAQPLELECRYRLLAGAKLASVAAESQGRVVSGRLQPRSTASNSTDILFLVDTSDPARAAAVETTRRHIERIISNAAAHQRFGVANFDAELEFVCPFPCSLESFRSAAGEIQAKGKTTELYRNVLEATKLFRASTADRRLIVLMSDGLAEDLAYHHADVVNAARRENIVITAIGYPRSVAQSIALQTLRRLSEETGGLFVQANLPEFDVPDSFITALLESIDNGGQIKFDLSEIQTEMQSGLIDVSLAFRTSKQNFVLQIPINIPPTEAEPARRVAREDTAATPNIVAQPPRVATPRSAPPVPTASTWTWFWYGLPAMVFSAILAVALAYAVLSRRRREEQRPQLSDQHLPHAFLVSAYDENLRYRIDHTPWRIGRSRNTELPLTDTSVSRLHAEIRRDALGQFTLQDLESLNGVFINGEAVELAHLEEGDRVEIGDVGFTFTMHDEDYARQEPTVLVRTRTPT